MVLYGVRRRGRGWSSDSGFLSPVNFPVWSPTRFENQVEKYLVAVETGSDPSGCGTKTGWKAVEEVVLGMGTVLCVFLEDSHRQKYSCYQVLGALGGQPGEFQRDSNLNYLG